MDSKSDPAPRSHLPSLLDFTPHDLLQHYPNIPVWAINAFYSLQQAQGLWTADARALLNMAYVPPTSVPLDKIPLHVGTLSQDLKGLFRTKDEWEDAKEQIDSWRLSRDLHEAKQEGWKQYKGKKMCEM